MKKRFSDEQIISILRKAKAGVSAHELCRKHAISDATFYTWRKKYGGMEVPGVKRLNSLEEENARLKKVLPKLCWIRKHFRWLSAKVLTTDQKREIVESMCDATSLSQRPASRLTGLSLSTASMKLSVWRLMHIYQAVSQNWRSNEGVLGTGASGSDYVGRIFPSTTSGYTAFTTLTA